MADTKYYCGPGSSVGIATDYGLDGPGIESRWGVRFSACLDRLSGSPSLLYYGYRGAKCGRGVLLTTHPLLVPWSWKSRAIPLPTLWATIGPVTGILYFTKYYCTICCCVRVLTDYIPSIRDAH